MAHVMVWRGSGAEDGVTGFWHHGIQCEDGSVVHYTGMDGVKTIRNARILRTSMADFQVDGTRRVHYVEEKGAKYAAHEVQQRALSRIGAKDYDLLFHNCESFARWCVHGAPTSFQGQGAVVGLAAAAVSMVLGGGWPGALLTALVAHKFWDRNGNRSRHRLSPANVEALHGDTVETETMCTKSTTT